MSKVVSIGGLYTLQCTEFCFRLGSIHVRYSVYCTLNSDQIIKMLLQTHEKTTFQIHNSDFSAFSIEIVSRVMCHVSSVTCHLSHFFFFFFFF